MEALKKISKNYKYDILALLLLLGIFIFFAGSFVGHQGHPFIDCISQGAYIPYEMLKGKVLYKDIYAIYGPFSYQINALLLFIFGESLNILYAVGIINSLIILLTLYLITRTISSRYTAFTVSFLVTMFCVFHYYIYNYIFPYAYAAAYALSSILLAVLFSIYYIKYSKPVFAVLFFLFAGISIMSKPDFILLIPVLSIIPVFLKPIKPKYIAISVFAFLSIPAVSVSILLFQGLNFTDILAHMQYLQKFTNTFEFNYFYSTYTGFYFDSDKFSIATDEFVIFAKYFILALVCIYPLILLLSGQFSSKIKFEFPKPVQLAGMLILIKILADMYHLRYPDIVFSWITLFNTLILLVFLILTYVKTAKNSKCPINCIRQMNLKDKIFLIIIGSGLMMSVRSFFFIDLHSFGTFLIPLSFAAGIIFIAEYIPQFITSINKDAWIKACVIILIAAGFSFTHEYRLRMDKAVIVPINTDRGTIYGLEYMMNPLNQSIDYVKTHIPPNASVLIIPQGTIINFLADRAGNAKYYDLIPPVLTAIGEDKVLEDLTQNPPDYIIINNRDTADWGATYFGKDYGIKIFDFIRTNYKAQEIMGSRLTIIVLKRRV